MMVFAQEGAMKKGPKSPFRASHRELNRTMESNTGTQEDRPLITVSSICTAAEPAADIARSVYYQPKETPGAKGQPQTAQGESAHD